MGEGTHNIMLTHTGMSDWAHVCKRAHGTVCDNNECPVCAHKNTVILYKLCTCT